MELQAVIEALSLLKSPCKVDVYTDSEYVRRGMTEWLAMGGYGAFVWGSYLVTAAAIVAELWGVMSRKRKALARAAAEAQGSAT